MWYPFYIIRSVLYVHVEEALGSEIGEYHGQRKCAIRTNIHN